TSSCIRTSTVVSVKKDGTGNIISRYYFSPQMLIMIDQLAGIQGQGGDGAAANLGMIADMAKPTKETLEADASHFGEGVRYAKHEPGKDDEGWEGYTVVYEFDDVTKIQIDQNSVPGKAKEFVEASGEDIDAKDGGNLTFGLEGDTLTIFSTFAKAGMGNMIDQEKLDQAKAMNMTPSQAMQMSAGMAQGMRVGFFVRAEEGIVETDATHVTGNLIILSDADISKVMKDPDFGAFLDSTVEDPKAATPEKINELFKEIEAMTIELSEEITVKLK
ncbi:hypothetical protein N9B73_09395, partial [Verrucomicrobiales bacterium]|nr:hypothetical protein [Verrucomicrobiales bacterium]